MSIEDESFPYDYDLELSHNSDKNFVFPHRNKKHTIATSALANSDPIVDQHVSSENSNASTSSLQNQNDSTHSSNDFCPPSETSGKTNSSEPNDLMKESQNKKSEFKRHSPHKSVSYQDIHSEYTKRRYKHVESKVGQYIANIKAQDKKRRSTSKFQKHSSLPDTLHGKEVVSELNNDCNKHNVMRHSTNDLNYIQGDNNGLQNDHNTEYYDNLTATTSSSSARDLASDGGIFLDNQTYDQLLRDSERKEYLETKMDEKNVENWRLKKNLDTMRIEYSMCKEKLKQQNQVPRYSGTYSSINATASIGQTCLQCLLYPRDTREKAMQTDPLLTPSPVSTLNIQSNDMFPTPLTPDSNNNSFDHAAVGMLAPVAHKISKTVATIQPISLNFSNLVEQNSRDYGNNNINTTIGFLRHRSDSIAARRKSTPLPVNTSRASSATSSVPNSSDSAIEIEVTESPNSQQQSRREEFIYYEQRSQRFTLVEPRNANSEINNNSATDSKHKRNSRKRQSLRTRVKRFFGACTQCDDPNSSSEISNNHSQIPLLEKSTKNNCRNVR